MAKLDFTFGVAVVTYNRAHDLRICLTAIDSLNPEVVPEVVVVDNASTDNTAEVLAEEFPQVHVESMNRNSGGAGGFNRAVQYAIESSWDFVWLMDDDAIPGEDALVELARVIDQLTPETAPSFLASLVMTPEGHVLETHVPEMHSEAQAQAQALEFNAICVEFASFVGVLVNVSIAKLTDLPRSEFFIIMDDLEYTSRLGAIRPGWLVPSSKVQHPRKISSERFNPRWVNGVRNSAWISLHSEAGSAWLRRRSRRRLPRLIARAALTHPSKRQFIEDLLKISRSVIANPPRGIN